MGWSKDQRKAAGAAAARAGFDADQVAVILRQFEHRAVHEGKLTRTSPDLNQSDFEVYMGICERAAGGKLGKFDAGRFSDTAERELHRIRYVAQRIANTLALTDRPDGGGRLLAPDGVGLRGWIRERVTHGRTDDINDLSFVELQNLINGLKAHARRNGVDLDKKSAGA